MLLLDMRVEYGGVMKLIDAMNNAIQLAKKGNCQPFGKVVEFLRFQHGLNYDQQTRFWNKWTGISGEVFEEYCGYADEQESLS